MKTILKSFQELNNNVKIDKISVTKPHVFNDNQNQLYKRALYGLKHFSEEEILKMHPKKKKRIRKVNIKAQKSLNLYKQAKANNYLNNFLKCYFPNHRIGNFDIIDSNYICKKTFKELKISKKEIIELFIKEGILVNNFYEI